jgi:hypothetical protein
VTVSPDVNGVICQQLENGEENNLPSSVNRQAFGAYLARRKQPDAIAAPHVFFDLPGPA